MYVRIAERRHGGTLYRYVHLAESYRDPDGRPRQRLVANLGSPDRYKPGEIEKVIAGLRRVFGRPEEGAPGAADEATVGVTTAYDFGGAYSVVQILDQLGWEEPIQARLRSRRVRFDLFSNIKVLVANRLLDPCSKLHILEWFEGVYVPGVRRQEVTYAHLLRAMDFLHRHKAALEVGFARKLISLFDLEVDLVFYDVTSVYFELDGPDTPGGDSTLRQHGYSRDHRPDLPQVVVGLVMTRDGIPLAHHVWSGNTVDKSTLREVVEDLKRRFGIRRCVFVGDRGMLSASNLEALTEAGLDFIVAHPLRNHNATREVLLQVASALKEAQDREAARAARAQEDPQEVVIETEWESRRFVVAHHEVIASQTRKGRVRKLKESDAFARELIEKLNRQDAGKRARGRPATDSGALIRLHDYLRDRKLLRYTKVYQDEKGLLHCEADMDARGWEDRIDGKLVLETSDRALPPQEVLARYKELADIERAFRTMKSSLDLRPVFHRVDRRIEAHVFLCVMALQIDRVMRHRLHQAGIHRLPTRVLETLDRYRLISTELGDERTHRALTTPGPQQLDLFQALGVPKPTMEDASDVS